MSMEMINVSVDFNHHTISVQARTYPIVYADGYVVLRGVTVKYTVVSWFP